MSCKVPLLSWSFSTAEDKYPSCIHPLFFLCSSPREARLHTNHLVSGGHLSNREYGEVQSSVALDILRYIPFSGAALDLAGIHIILFL